MRVVEKKAKKLSIENRERPAKIKLGCAEAGQEKMK